MKALNKQKDGVSKKIELITKLNLQQIFNKKKMAFINIKSEEQTMVDFKFHVLKKPKLTLENFLSIFLHIRRFKNSEQTN